MSLLAMVGLLAGVLLVLGILSTTAALTCFLVLVTAQLLDQQVYSNHLVLCTLLLAFLALARAGSRWSVDARLRGGPEVVPWWPQLLMMTQVSICYLFAGLSKINPRFLSGETLPESLWLEAPHGVFRALAVATICTEVFIALGLWWRRTRVLAVLAGAALHVGILALFDGGWLTFGAFGLLCASTYWMFLQRPAIVRGEAGLEAVAPSSGPIEVSQSTG